MNTSKSTKNARMNTSRSKKKDKSKEVTPKNEIPNLFHKCCPEQMTNSIINFVQDKKIKYFVNRFFLMLLICSNSIQEDNFKSLQDRIMVKLFSQMSKKKQNYRKDKSKYGKSFRRLQKIYKLVLKAIQPKTSTQLLWRQIVKEAIQIEEEIQPNRGIQSSRKDKNKVIIQELEEILREAVRKMLIEPQEMVMKDRQIQQHFQNEYSNSFIQNSIEEEEKIGGEQIIFQNRIESQDTILKSEQKLIFQAEQASYQFCEQCQVYLIPPSNQTYHLFTNQAQIWMDIQVAKIKFSRQNNKKVVISP